MIMNAPAQDWKNSVPVGREFMLLPWKAAVPPSMEGKTGLR